MGKVDQCKCRQDRVYLPTVLQFQQNRYKKKGSYINGISNFILINLTCSDYFSLHSEEYFSSAFCLTGMILRHLATFPTIKIINSVPKLVELVGVWQLRTMKLCSVLSHVCVRPGSLMVSSSVMLNALEVCQNCFDLQVTVIAKLLNPLIWVGLKVHFFFLIRYLIILHYISA